MARTPRIVTLRNNIAALGWHITAFEFSYNKYTYIILFEDAKGLRCRSKYIVAFLTFIDQADETRRLVVNANSEGFDGPSPKEIMDYFHVGFKSGPRGFFPTFYNQFNDATPERYIAPINRHIKDLQAIQLGVRDNVPNPTALYCYGIKRNPKVNGKQYQRSIFNTNKTQLLRPDLYAEFGGDATLSFCYSDNPADALSDLEIKLRFSRREAELL